MMWYFFVSFVLITKGCVWYGRVIIRMKTTVHKIDNKYRQCCRLTTLNEKHRMLNTTVSEKKSCYSSTIFLDKYVIITIYFSIDLKFSKMHVPACGHVFIEGLSPIVLKRVHKYVVLLSTE
jgi:hypothetical protein